MLLLRFPFVTQLLDGWGFVYRIRASMVLDLRSPRPSPSLPPGYAVAAWDAARLAETAAVDHAAYSGTIDARLYAPYFRTTAGCERMWREAIAGKFGRFDAEQTRLLLYHGRVCGNVMISSRGTREAFVGNVSVEPGHQGRGLGKQLLLESLGSLERAGFDRVTLAVTPDNTRAFELYQRLGFRVTSYFPMAHFDRRR